MQTCYEVIGEEIVVKFTGGALEAEVEGLVAGVDGTFSGV